MKEFYDNITQAANVASEHQKGEEPTVIHYIICELMFVSSCMSLTHEAFVP